MTTTINGTIFSSVSTPSSAVGRAPFNEWMEEQRATEPNRDEDGNRLITIDHANPFNDEVEAGR